MKKEIKQIVIDCLKNINEEINSPILEDIDENTKIFGVSGALDSLALVSFITDVEEMIAYEYSIDIVLADEKAMSQRTSPFRDVKSLCDYISKLIEI